MIAAHGCDAVLLDESGSEVARIPVQAWVFIDNEGLPMVALVDRLHTLKPGVDRFEIVSSEVASARG